MDKIQTIIFCPECKKEVNLILCKEIISQPIRDLISKVNLPQGNEIAFFGMQECFCGKIVKATFLIEAFSKH